MARQRPKRRTEPTAAGTLIESILKRHGVAVTVREHRIVTGWRELVGERVAARAWPDGLKDGVLFVRVTSSAWMHELSFLRDDVAKRANEMCGGKVVRAVRFHVGGRRREDSDADDVVAALARRARIKAPPPPRPSPTPDSLVRIDAESDRVDDPELREAIRAARRRIGL